MFRVVTVAREYGSGGARLAATLAARLNWRLVDNALIMAVANAAKVDPELARRYDERVDSWLHRMSRRAFTHGGFEGVASVSGSDIFDAETVAALSKSLVLEAYRRGDCVIVGRGAQCVLQDRDDAFHVFVYAPWREKLDRIQKRLDKTDVAQLVESTERMREEFVRLNFGCDRYDRHMYHLMISSALGEEPVVSSILSAMSAMSRPNE